MPRAYTPTPPLPVHIHENIRTPRIRVDGGGGESGGAREGGQGGGQILHLPTVRDQKLQLSKKKLQLSQKKSYNPATKLRAPKAPTRQKKSLWILSCS